MTVEYETKKLLIATAFNDLKCKVFAVVSQNITIHYKILQEYKHYDTPPVHYSFLSVFVYHPNRIRKKIKRYPIFIQNQRNSILLALNFVVREIIRKF